MTSGSMLMGIIPAYAGSTITRLLFTLRFSDHPRIRGEHPVVLDAGVGDRGSSPHTRGARPLVSAALPPVRIIPAYAGSTGHDQDGGRRPQDHPRIRGEHWPPPPPVPGPPGSSPHTRGAPQDARHGRKLEGIIPAYAGSTSPDSAPSGPGKDHPRIRGEHAMLRKMMMSAPGSSPHTRGAHLGRLDGEDEGGIIPAYAGSTARARRRPFGRRDHPRIRGEHRRVSRISGMSSGSSPHTRGAQPGAPPGRH